MHALLVHFEIDVEHLDDGIARIGRAATLTSEQPGFHSGYWMLDRQSGRAALVTSWGFEADARRWKDYMEGNPPRPGMRRISLDMYEIVSAFDPK
jgi:hypothetical protein